MLIVNGNIFLMRWIQRLLTQEHYIYRGQMGYSLDVVIFEGYSPLNNRVIQWTCVILEVIHRWRRLEANIICRQHILRTITIKEVLILVTNILDQIFLKV
jgi:hypothetical protein